MEGKEHVSKSFRDFMVLVAPTDFRCSRSDRLDHFLYRIIGDRKNLNEVRAASPILLAAICTVGSLHLNTPDFESLYQEFVSIAAAQTFSRRNNVDDIRGLCVAAFWLSDVSWR